MTREKMFGGSHSSTAHTTTVWSPCNSVKIRNARRAHQRETEPQLDGSGVGTGFMRMCLGVIQA